MLHVQSFEPPDQTSETKILGTKPKLLNQHYSYEPETNQILGSLLIRQKLWYFGLLPH